MAAPDLLPGPRSIGASEACLDAVRLRVRECEETTEASATPVVRQRRHIVLTDLHNLAGWVCFDAGLTGSARRHFDHALVLAAAAGTTG